MTKFRIGDHEVRLEPVETEDRLGSVRFSFQLTGCGQGGRVEYTEDSVWVTNTEIDRFVEAIPRFSTLEGDVEDDLALMDMSENPVFALVYSSGRWEIEVDRALSTCDDHRIQYRGRIEADSVHIVKDAFEAFPKWW